MARRNFFRRGLYNNPSSINAIISDYKRFKDVVETEAVRILETAAQMQLDYTLPLVPVDTGALKESGRASAVRTPKGVVALVSFGGPDAPVTPTKNAPGGVVNYAAVANYDTNKGSSPFFLERGAQESKDAVDAYIVSELRKIKP